MPIVLPNGDQIRFESIDGRTGFYATDDETQINTFIQLEREHRGGVYAISQEEYERDHLKKKAESTLYDFRSKNREEITSGPAQDTLTQRKPVEIVAPVAAAEIQRPEVKSVKSSKGPTIGRRVIEP